jgi:hypothetical protein
MATWDGLRSYIKSNYVTGMEEPEIFGLDFTLDDERSQRALVRKMMLGTDEWVEIATPVSGRVGDVSSRAAVTMSR